MKIALPVQKDGPRMNEEIRVREVQLIDQQGKNHGVVPIESALAIASEAGLDLVEIALRPEPPPLDADERIATDAVVGVGHDETGEAEEEVHRQVGARRPRQSEQPRDVEDDDRECEERAERVEVVGPGELPRTGDRAAHRHALDHENRDHETDRREPREPRQDEREHEEGDRRKDEPTGEPRDHEPPRSGTLLKHEHAGTDEGRAQECAEQRRRQHEGNEARDVRPDDGERRRREAERQTSPEVLPVEADRLHHQLADRPLGGRQRGWTRLSHGRDGSAAMRPALRRGGARRHASPRSDPTAGAARCGPA